MTEELFHRSPFIVIHRKILDWQWYTNPNCSRLFMHLLLKANYTDKHWNSHLIKRGQLVTSLESLAKQTTLTIQQVRTALTKLKSTHEITYHTTHNFTYITVTNYAQYQDVNTRNNKSITNDQQMINKSITTTKQLNNDNNDNNDIPSRHLKKIRKVKYPTIESLVYELFSEEEKDYFAKNTSSVDIPDLIEDMRLGCESKGYKYKNFYAALQTWARTREKKNSPARGIKPAIVSPLEGKSAEEIFTMTYGVKR